MHLAKSAKVLSLFGLFSAVLGAGLPKSQNHFRQDGECRFIFGPEEANGTFTSPNYPNDYPNEAACTWEMVVEEGSRILLRFTDFHLEASFECSNDYLEIYNGDSYEIYCGRNLPADIVSVGNAMSVVLVNDGLINVGDRFTAEYYTIDGNGGGDDNETVTVPCEHQVDIGGEVGGEGYAYGVFYSPHHPDVYPDNVACRWDLLTSPDSLGIEDATKVVFLRFRTAVEDVVSYHVNGVPSDVTFSGDYQVWRNSSRVDMPTITKFWASNVSVTFNANDGGDLASGFLFAYAHKVFYSVEPLHQGAAPKNPVQRLEDPFRLYPAKNHVIMDFRTMTISSTNDKLNTVAHFGDSHGHLLQADNDTVDHGFFMSPNHPRDYDNWELVSFEIIVDEGEQVALYPLRFILDNISNDFVYIKDSADDSYLELTGEDPFDYVWVTTKTSKAEIIFTSDDSFTASGFLFAVAALDLD